MSVKTSFNSNSQNPNKTLYLNITENLLAIFGRKDWIEPSLNKTQQHSGPMCLSLRPTKMEM